MTENTFDAYSWQTLETKQKGISQVMTSKNPARSCEDIDETAQSYAITKAICAGNPEIKEKMELENDVNQLRMLQMNYENEKYRMQDRLYKQLPHLYKETAEKLELYKSDRALIEEHKEKPFSIQILGHEFTDKAEASAAIYDLTVKYKDKEDWTRIGTMQGFSLLTNFYDGRYRLQLQAAGSYNFERGAEPAAICDRLQLVLEKISEKKNEAENQLIEIDEQMKRLERQLEEPFSYENELKIKEARLAELDKLIEEKETKRESSEETSEDFEEKEELIEGREDINLDGSKQEASSYSKKMTAEKRADFELD